MDNRGCLDQLMYKETNPMMLEVNDRSSGQFMPILINYIGF